jgi:ankyrin repeat protein
MMRVLSIMILSTLLSVFFTSCGKKAETEKKQSSRDNYTYENATPNESLQYAVRRGEALNAKAALAMGADPNQFINEGDTLLTYAIKTNKPHITEVLLEASASSNMVNKNFMAPILLAVKKNNLAIVRQLLRYETRLNIINLEGDNPLTSAIDNNGIEIIFELLIAGANPFFKIIDGMTPYHYAISKEDRSILNVFETHKEMTENKNLNTIIKEKITQGDDNSLEYINLVLMREGKSIVKFYTGDLFYDTLTQAPVQHRDALIRKYIEWGFSINAETGQSSLIHQLVNDNAISDLETALLNGANPNHIDHEEKPALWYAIEGLKIEAVKSLLKYDAKQRLVVYGENESFYTLDMCDALPSKRCGWRRCDEETLAKIKLLKETILNCR